MNIIEVQNLTKRFGQLTAVDHISFNVGKGEIFGLLGPNGAGKSTTIRMLCTLSRPSEGQAKIAGLDIVKDAAKVREKVGLVAEKIILYDRLTAAENLRLFGKLHHWSNEIIQQQTEKLLKLVKMEKWANKQVGTFSTGMKQRVNIARALFNEPEVLFLDEPTLGLDPQTTRSIRDFIMELREHNITIVITTHIMAEAEMVCDRIGIIDYGKIVALDKTPNLKKIVLKTDTTVLDLDVPNLTNQIVTSLNQLSSIKSLTQDKEEAGKLRIHTTGKEALDKVIDVVRSQGGTLRAIQTEEPTLEDVFLHLTGHEMRDTADNKVKSDAGPGPRHGFKAPSRVR